MQATNCQHIEASALLLEEALLCPVRHSGASGVYPNLAVVHFPTYWGSWTHLPSFKSLTLLVLLLRNALFAFYTYSLV